MAIQIRELIVKAQVNRSSSSSTNPRAGIDAKVKKQLKREIMEETIEQMMELLESMGSR